jgi:hypothetical protein
MEDTDNEQQDALNPGEQSDSTQSDTIQSEVDIEALKQKAEKADEYKKYADRTAAENKELKRKLQPTETNSQGSSSTASDERFDRIELKADGYSNDEINEIMELGGKTALQNPLVQKAIEIRRKEEKSKSATPTGTAKSPIFQKYSAKDLKTIPLDKFEEMVTPEV